MRKAGLVMALLCLPSFAFSEGDGSASPESTKKEARQNPSTAWTNPQEKITKLDGLVSECRSALKRVAALYTEARATKELLKMNCVGVKFTGVKAMAKVATNAYDQVLDNVAKENWDMANHGASKIEIAYTKAMQLRTEAEQCLGDKAAFTGATEIKVETDDDGSDDPVTPAPVVPNPAPPAVGSAV